MRPGERGGGGSCAGPSEPGWGFFAIRMGPGNAFTCLRLGNVAEPLGVAAQAGAFDAC